MTEEEAMKNCAIKVNLAPSKKVIKLYPFNNVKSVGISFRWSWKKQKIHQHHFPLQLH